MSTALYSLLKIERGEGAKVLQFEQAAECDAQQARPAVAEDVAALHSDSNNLSKETALTEKGQPVKARGDKPNEHDILTGSQLDGRAYTEAADHTCNNWTSNGMGNAILGAGHHAGVATYRHVSYAADCTCFHYTSKPIRAG